MRTIGNDRVLVVAPHPDDEAIGAGGLIQRAIARGGDVCAVFITAGESNPWPQRYVNRRWRITPAQREEWGELRCTEARQSLATLGARSDCSIFLGYPDQQISTLARTGNETLADTLRAIMRDYQPTILIAPSAQDLHADHRAVAYFAHQAVRGLGDNAPEVMTYVVHGEGDPARLHLSLDLTDRELHKKRDAIQCHRSQLHLSRERFLAYARPVEEFFVPEFDLVCTESRAKERIGALRHSCRVLFGRAAREVIRKNERLGEFEPDPHTRRA
jgi:LmbE family N-acetylglucosaminyl deacetylase